MRSNLLSAISVTEEESCRWIARNVTVADVFCVIGVMEQVADGIVFLVTELDAKCACIVMEKEESIILF